MEQRFVPALPLVWPLESTGVVLKQIGWESILVATIPSNLAGELNISVAEDETKSGLRVAHQTVEFVAEPFDIVHGVENDYSLLVHEPFNVGFERGSQNLLLLGISKVLLLRKAQELLIYDLDFFAVCLLKILF